MRKGKYFKLIGCFWFEEKVIKGWEKKKPCEMSCIEKKFNVLNVRGNWKNGRILEEKKDPQEPTLIYPVKIF